MSGEATLEDGLGQKESAPIVAVYALCVEIMFCWDTRRAVQYLDGNMVVVFESSDRQNSPDSLFCSMILCVDCTKSNIDSRQHRALLNYVTRRENVLRTCYLFSDS